MKCIARALKTIQHDKESAKVGKARQAEALPLLQGYRHT